MALTKIDIEYTRGDDGIVRLDQSQILSSTQKQFQDFRPPPDFDKLVGLLGQDAVNAHKRLDRAMRSGRIVHIVPIYNAWKAIKAHGVRLFRPTAAQCEAMEHVDVGITLADYQQPFPAMIVQFPPEYARDMQRPFVIVHHTDQLVYAWRPVSETLEDTVFCSMPGNTIEHALTTRREGTIGDIENKEAIRAAINCCLLLSNYPTTTRNLLPAGLVRANRERARQQRRTYLPPMEVRLVQEIDFHEVANEPVEQGTTTRNVTHYHVTHWRRGHWKMQPYGRGRQLRKRIFIKAVLVNARFDGIGERQVIYQSA